VTILDTRPAHAATCDHGDVVVTQGDSHIQVGRLGHIKESVRRSPRISAEASDGRTGPDPRDHIVTRSLERDLSALEAEVVDEQLLDPAEAPARLARHAMGEPCVSLEGDESADFQAERVSALLRAFDETDELDAEVALPARVLQGIKDRSPLGATEKRAVDELVALGAEVRVAFDARTTKLHAKPWLLERESA
jgi:hypothetical protein